MKDIVPAIEKKVCTRKNMKKKQTKFSNYYNNFEFFCKKIDAFGSDELNNFAEFFLDNCSVIMILCKDTDQALSMFHSLNSRGMPLTDSDIIFASLYKNAKSIKKLDEFEKEWKKLKGDEDASDNGNFYEIAEFGLSEDDVYLQQMYRYVAEKSVSDANSSGNVSDKSCRDFFETKLNAGADPLEVCKDLVALTEMWKEVFEYTLVKILMKMNSNSRRFLAVYFNRFDSVDELKKNKDETNEFVKVLLRLFALYELTETSYSSDPRFKQFLIDNMGKISDKTVSVNSIKDIFDKHIKVEWDDTDIISKAEDYEKDALIYLKEYLYDETLNILPHKVDVEHIMPQKGTKRHKELFMEEAGIINQEEYRSYLNRIGNKILLEAEINRSVSAEPFASKLFKPSIGSDTEDKGYYYETSNYPIAKKLVADYKVLKESGATVRWKKEDIEKATKEASEKIVRFIFDK